MDPNDSEFIKLRERVHALDELVKAREKVHTIEVDVAVLKQAQNDSDKALEIAALSLKHSQEVSNEWRKENIDQRALFMTSEQTRGLIAEEASERRAIDGRVSVIEKGGSAAAGRHGAFEDVWLKFAVVATLLMTALSLVYKFVMGK